MKANAVAAIGALISALACSAPGDGPDSAGGTWVGTITTEGNVTTVVNESGSVWGSDVALEEELSIGEDAGDEPYLFGRIQALGATEDRIYVLEGSLATVRVYDDNGEHLFDFGRRGQGPGELNIPWAMAVDPRGRVLVQEVGRISIFDLEGSFIETWPSYPSRIGLPLTISMRGTAFVPSRWTENETSFVGVVATSSDGVAGERYSGPPFDVDEMGRGEITFGTGDNTNWVRIPYSPAPLFAVLSSEAIVFGLSNEYLFTQQRVDGSLLVVQRDIDLPAVSAEQREWITKEITLRARNVQPNWTWNGNPVPETKPAFDGFLGDRSGRIWAQRILRTERVTDCDPNPAEATGTRPRPCWRDIVGYDVFEEASGRFLGQIEKPVGARHIFPRPVFMENSFVFATEDQAGTIMVKRYRLVLPGEERE